MTCLKKLAAIAAVIICSLSASAKETPDSLTAQTNKFARTCTFLNPSIGVQVDNWELGFGYPNFDIEVGRRKHIKGAMLFDMFKVGVNVPVALPFFSAIRVLTGLRWHWKSGIYCEVHAGVGAVVLQPACLGLSYDVGAGYNFSRRFSLGVVWVDNQFFDARGSWDRFAFGQLGLRFGINF